MLARSGPLRGLICGHVNIAFCISPAWFHVSAAGPGTLEYKLSTGNYARGTSQHAGRSLPRLQVSCGSYTVCTVPHNALPPGQPSSRTIRDPVRDRAAELPSSHPPSSALPPGMLAGASRRVGLPNCDLLSGGFERSPLGPRLLPSVKWQNA